MKRILNLLFLFFSLAVFLTACSDTDKDNVPELIIPSSEATQSVDETNGIGGFDAVVHSPSPTFTPQP